jgi:hypothetical protein
MRKLLFLAAAASFAFTAVAARAECVATSGERRVPLLELYTSEGCDSCPPADRWMSELPARGFGGDRVVVLAFHVDYWDRLGWIDKFGQTRFSERQRQLNDRNRARAVYTPQLVLNGKDYRRGGDADFARRMAELNRDRPRAAISLVLEDANDRVNVNGTWSASDGGDGQAWLALYENRLSTQVAAGENRGKLLQHDFVVRDIAGPFPKGAIAHSFALDKRWNRANVGVASFVQDPRSGDVLQSLLKALCAAPRS